MSEIHIIGGGLAGSEAAWQAASQLQAAGVQDTRIILHEMRPVRKTDAHETDNLAELVCSNSFRSDDATQNAVGLLHEEMRRCGSLILRAADANQVPAGGALAVDRHLFSGAVTQAIADHPMIEIRREEVDGLPPADWHNVIIATGPLTSLPLAEAIHDLTGEAELAFFDAIAPIIHKDSINFDIAWYQSRYDKKGPGGDGADYINLPFTEEEYEHFIDALLTGEKTDFKEWEKNTPYFEGCLPVEVMAERGRETLRFGPMKPVGLTDPRTGSRPHAVMQLRQDNALGTLYNMVGFQTKLKYGAQQEVFRLIPGLEKAQFARLGGIHRNTFINSPRLLDETFRMKKAEQLRFAGQITGVEGYLESAATGLLAGRFAALAARGQSPTQALPPETTALGALHRHITGGHLSDGAGAKGAFQPMNVNFGLFPFIETPKEDAEGRRIKGKEKGFARKRALCARALSDIDDWLSTMQRAA
ncbi:methylenetetrahydrofolate--tRNA-(uracil(54)-C(5))-methyltransferase (FADH(2)-oxidizing) TrmFO [Parvularcula sp. IMCC14364]|uniref:methylenetetrahydrofolate--tRNA-(uracil(54)- C(5))-methyltransferase (FADH(2)-oxidizing) TrmFO n=1 Tax=Parvularcula sp. IMCC14364 TaxID=3067902 RepID=UPI002740BA4F|nr:methylenetetrahydrofolate--tRNA-(uracil(54)-C(5))-methyltransferase (FADH(2)-oxidizing) TrmFO [Parvularcula sp. IMCC14364]